MTQYVKVTLKEFEAMRSEIEAGFSQCGLYTDDDAIKTLRKAVSSAKAIEKRNKLTPTPYLTIKKRA